MRKLGRLFSGRVFPCILIAILFAAGTAVLTVLLPRVFAPVAAAERLAAAAAALAVANGRDLPAVRTAKLFLLLFPWTGIFLCLLLKSPPPSPPPPPPFCGSAMERAARLAESGLLRAETADYFPVGGEMWKRLKEDIAAAKERVWLAYYIVAEGALLSEVLSLLEERARAGADVRLMFDDFGSALTLPRGFCRDLSARGIAVKRSRPVRFPGRAFNRRDHRKIAVADGAAYVGGVNLADEYAGLKIRFGHWKDTALRLTGEPAAALAALYEEAWSGKKQEFLPHSELFGKTGSPCVLFSDDAELRSDRRGVRLLFRLVSSARESVFLYTPYLALDKSLRDALAAAARAGVDVRLMIPHIPDKKTAFALTRENARELMRAGVGVREYTAGFLHAKSIVADGTYVAVSSYNLDYRSLYSQAECGALLADAALAERLNRDFAEAWETGTEVPAAGVREKAAAFFLRLFAPLI